MPFTINAVTFLFCTHFQNPLNGMNKNDDCEMMASVNLSKMFFFPGLGRSDQGGIGQTGSDREKNYLLNLLDAIVSQSSFLLLPFKGF